MSTKLNFNPDVRSGEATFPNPAPSHLSAPLTTGLFQSTLRPVAAAEAPSSTDQPSFLHRAWQSIVNCFISLLSCLRSFWPSAESPNGGGLQLSSLSANETQLPDDSSDDEEIPLSTIAPNDRETRLIDSDTEIHNRLDRQMQRSQEQMEKEPMKGFNYINAPESWDMHEVTVGNFHVGISHNIGNRPTMEDEHLAVSFDLKLAGRNYPIQLFGILDGHGGTLAACFVRDNLQKKLEKTLIEYNQNGLCEAGIWKALKMACVRLNRDLKEAHGLVAAGTTAAIMMFLDGVVYSANVGDSRIVLDNDGTPFQLTEDAKPNDERYQKGIEKRGGFVVYFGGAFRVNGSIACARAFGDFHANGVISVRPKITAKPLSEIQPGSHLILCCDGIYDVSRTIDIVNAAHKHRDLSPGTLAGNITYSALISGSGDNLSVIVVKI